MRRIFSTKGIPPKDTVRRWQEAIHDRLVPVEQSRLGDRPFAGTLDVADVGSIPITFVKMDALRTDVTPRTIRLHDKHDTVSVAMVRAGEWTSTQDDRASVQRPGDFVIYDRRPVVLTSSVGTEAYAMDVPRERLERMLGPARLYTSLTIGAGQPGTRLVTTFFEELIHVRQRIDEDTAKRMSSIAIDLLVAGIAERLAQDVPKPLYGTVVVQRAKAYIEENLHDPCLDGARVAAAVGVSLRRLQQLFGERERYVTGWIWERRLERAQRQLADPACLHFPLGKIAYGCGFINQAHFSRRFKDRFGTTPSEYRQAVMISMVHKSN